VAAQAVLEVMLFNTATQVLEVVPQVLTLYGLLQLQLV
jgi:hypothetical protein